MNKIFYKKPLFSNTTFPHILKLPPQTLRKKNPHVETLRGLAITLVVIGHMIGYANTGGMRVGDDSFFRYFYYSIDYIQLPLFTVISGWAYANKPVQHSNHSEFIKGKLRRLIIPMFVISTLLFLLRMIIPGTNTTPELNDLPRNLFFPYDVYWYLFSLFIIFLIIPLLDTKPFFHKPEGWFLTLVFALILLQVMDVFLDAVPNLFSFKGAIYLFPFFLLGIGIFRFKELLLNDKVTFATLLVLIVSVILQHIIWFGHFPLQGRYSVLAMAVGISGVLFLFKLKPTSNLLIFIGGHAYTIFLFHVFFTGGSRIILLKTGVGNSFVIFVSGVLCAIVFPILLETILQKSGFLRYYFLGLKKNEN